MEQAYYVVLPRKPLINSKNDYKLFTPSDSVCTKHELKLEVFNFLGGCLDIYAIKVFSPSEYLDFEKQSDLVSLKVYVSRLMVSRWWDKAKRSFSLATSIADMIGRINTIELIDSAVLPYVVDKRVESVPLFEVLAILTTLGYEVGVIVGGEHTDCSEPDVTEQMTGIINLRLKQLQSKGF